MVDLFFGTGYATITQSFIKVSTFIALSGLLLYIINLVLSKVLYKKSKHRKEINNRLVFLWSIFTYFIVFNVYIFFLFYFNGIDSMIWTSLAFYFGIAAQIIVYFGLLGIFLIKRKALIEIIKQKSIY